jgi:S-adenosylmethionine:tRNA ribosyltransferase-isomerase
MKTLERIDPTHSARLAFHLPPELEAGEPPEARGLTRDAVRMMVAERATNRLTNSTFVRLPTFLEAGDLVVINTSAVIPAAVPATTSDGTPLIVHLSTQFDDDVWVIELRCLVGDANHTTARWTGRVPDHLDLGGGATIELLEPYLGSERLWTARLVLGQPVLTWLAVHGRPIRYAYVDRPQPLSAYQNVYATEPGSAEMPSAGRPFTTDLITRLVAKGIDVAPLVLHTGVASLESNETPYPERLRVPASTAARVNATRAAGGRVIAVGTTVVRALESATDTDGHVESIDGWTDLIITPERGVRVVDGLITGWHEPQASHLLMLEAIAGRELLELSYAESLREGYLWHEFGDIHLIL